jgi:SAM-dependent methyltransferase
MGVSDLGPDSGQSRADLFWSRPEVVELFAGRDPDHRLMEMLRELPDGTSVRVLDLGCAGGRNANALARAGADVHALDRSEAMVEHTRGRLADVFGEAEALERVHRGAMQNLSIFENGSFDWVVALGIYTSAADRDAFDRAVDETARVLAPGGMALVATFSPLSQPEGKPLEGVADQPDVYVWRSGRHSVLLEPAELDLAFAAHGLHVDVPTATVRVPMDDGFRLTINARYRKALEPR